eukprot:3697566-Amphidinium_carterae.1
MQHCRSLKMAKRCKRGNVSDGIRTCSAAFPHLPMREFQIISRRDGSWGFVAISAQSALSLAVGGSFLHRLRGWFGEVSGGRAVSGAVDVEGGEGLAATPSVTPTPRKRKRTCKESCSSAEPFHLKSDFLPLSPVWKPIVDVVGFACLHSPEIYNKHDL